MSDLQGLKVLVVGGGRNIGRAVAVEAARQGAAVAIAVRSNVDEAESVAEEARAHGVEAQVVRCDVSDPTEVEAMMDALRGGIGAPDVLVHAAAIRTPASVYELDVDDWAVAVGTNLSGLFYCVRAVLPGMRDAGFGRIIAIGGTDGERGPAPVGCLYTSATKAGVKGLIFAVAREAGPDGITANLVSPGPIATAPGKEARYRTYTGRIGAPEEVAVTCAWLASPQAGYVNGNVMLLDGGGFEMLGLTPHRAPSAS